MAIMDETTFSSGSMYSSGEEEILANEGLRLSRSVRWRERSRHVSFEPALFLFCFALSLSEIELTHQIIYQTCRVQGFELDDCLQVGTEVNSTGVQEIEAQVQPAAASVTTVIVVIKSVIPAFGALLLGAWSDRYGRKPVVVIAACGMLITYFALTGLNFLSSFVQVNPWYYVLAYIPFSIPGGVTILVATIFAFVSDVSTDENRTIKMGFIKSSIAAGALAGSFSSGYILEWTSAVAIFVIATISILIGLIYIALFVEDSVIPSSDSELGSSLAELFSPSPIKDIVQAVVRKRTRHFWSIIWLIIGCIALVDLAAGSNSVAYKFAHRKFEWNHKQYNHFLLVENVLIILANILGISLLKKLFDWPDTLVALISIISFILSSVIKGFATEGWHLFLAEGLTFFKGMEGVALLSVCAYLLPSNEIAKFYALAMSLLGLVPLAAGPLFTYFYKETYGSGPELLNFLAAGIYGASFMTLGTTQWLLNRRSQPELLL